MAVWDGELAGDVDGICLVKGVKDGFDLVKHVNFRPVELENYNSSLDSLHRDLVEN